MNLVIDAAGWDVVVHGGGGARRGSTKREGEVVREE